MNGQDGSYLSELLLENGYRVIGTSRDRNADRLMPTREKIELVSTPLLDQGRMEEILREYKPVEIYNLAARASSRELWSDPVSTGDLNALAVVRWLDAVHRVDPGIRFVQASSSEVFGRAAEVPQTESTPFQPRNPYGVAKAFGHWITAVYRKERGLFACSCILYNHESPRRGMDFVTRKISHGAASIKLGLADQLVLGDLDARRDWGFAGDYVQAMWLALQQAGPDDYIVATGETHSVRDFCQIAFAHVGLKYEDHVKQNPENFRPPETAVLVGNPAKANQLLDWRPTVSFQELVRMMVDADLQLLQGKRKEDAPPGVVC